ncbi:response regulator transcription factor [Gordoniibacillus kamchatkensis]|uniref:response regulator transcription factor n=1 Tax=Gordoniibacillus kamchatkensis TaxID=1590651 RepID=UPI000AA7404D|nr:response regulator transcription factor [Paenibacillus sp. VKM B-2647]
MTRILLIEDDDLIARALELELGHEGYETTRAKDGREGLQLALNESWDLLLLDILLPELSGLEVLRRLRQAGQTMPVIMVTGRDEVPDRVSGFNHGANDYVTKPFAIEELLARIRNLLQLTGKDEDSGGPSVLQSDSLELQMKSRSVTRDGKPIELTPKEFDLLAYLLKHKGEVCTREQIMEDVWGYDFVGETNVVDVYIRYLRQKIDKGYPLKLLQTVRGAGYMLREEAPGDG